MYVSPSIGKLPTCFRPVRSPFQAFPRSASSGGGLLWALRRLMWGPYVRIKKR